MSQPTNSNGQYARRVTLPSGRSIEVVYFEPLAAEAAGAAAMPQRRRRRSERLPRVRPRPGLPGGLGGGLRDALGGRAPLPELRVVARSASSTRSTVDKFDEQLDLGTEALVKDLRRLVQANMEAEADRFAAALDANAILPEDF